MSQIQSLRRILFDTTTSSFYYNYHNVEPDKQSWNNNHPIFPYLIRVLKPELIIEVGTYKGVSAIEFAKIAESLDLGTHVIAIDHFLGHYSYYLGESDESLPFELNTNTTRESFRWLNIQNGSPSLYKTFMKNVITSSCTDRITPVQLDTVSAYKLLHRIGITAEIIYIDGDHSYDAAYWDLKNYSKLLKGGGAIVLDDYGYSGVTRAVYQFLAESWSDRDNADEWIAAFEYGKAVLTRNRSLSVTSKLAVFQSV